VTREQFRQILQDLHKAGICHGDLRKENMCCLDGTGSIIDFDHAFETRADEHFKRDVQELEGVLASYIY
jgi:tRNA A-37 threonylcarbamoyl transferase component Bud32